MGTRVYQENAHDHLRAVYIGRMEIGDRVLNQFEEEWTIIELFDEGETVVLERGDETLVLPRRLVGRPIYVDADVTGDLLIAIWGGNCAIYKDPVTGEWKPCPVHSPPPGDPD
jgi:hypothetical protein